MDFPQPLFHLFSSFQTNITILQQIYVKKCPSSKCCWDSNPQPSEYESPPVTTRPGLKYEIFYCNVYTKKYLTKGDLICAALTGHATWGQYYKTFFEKKLVSAKVRAQDNIPISAKIERVLLRRKIFF